MRMPPIGLFIFFSLLAAAGCSGSPDRTTDGRGAPGSSSYNDGTQHGGGGSVGESTAEQVNAAIDQAIKMANEPHPTRNVFANFIWDHLQDSFYDQNRRKIFPNLDNPEVDFEDAFESSVLRAFTKNEISRIKSGDCPHHKEQPTADASVSEFNLSAKICFSIGNLEKTSPTIILREVLGLVLHESCHMAGCPEEEAKRWQDDFTKYFATRFGDITVDDFTLPAKEKISLAGQFIGMAASYAELDPSSAHVFASMGSAAASLIASPYNNDPIAIELKANPNHPELVENYWIAINILKQKIQAAFQPPHPAFSFCLLGIETPDCLIDPEDARPKIIEIRDDLVCLRENLDALTTGRLRNRCRVKQMDDRSKFQLLPRAGGAGDNPFTANPSI